MSDIDTGNDITLSFGDVAEDFYSGNMSKVITQMKQFIYQRLFSEINLNKSIMFKTAVLILFLAVINNFTKSFEKYIDCGIFNWIYLFNNLFINFIRNSNKDFKRTDRWNSCIYGFINSSIFSYSRFK